MVRFDISLQYHFGFFYGALPEEIQRSRIEQLQQIMQRDVDNVRRPRIRFPRAPVYGEALVGSGGQQHQMPMMAWQGTNMKMSWTPLRFDFALDALAFQDASDEELPLEQVRKRLAPNLIEAITRLDFPISRFVLIVTGEATMTDAPEGATAVVARKFFSADIIRAAAAGQLIELTGRTNAREQWPLGPLAEGGAEEIQVNRIESGEARWSLNEGQPRTVLVWQFDVNTAPEATPAGGAFTPAAAETFYTNATRWISERMRLIDAR